MGVQPNQFMKAIRHAFTLVELLTVIAIIGVLAALTLAVFGVTKKHMLIVQTRFQENDIVTAIENYESVYGRFPMHKDSQTLASLLVPYDEDLSFGERFATPDPQRVVYTGDYVIIPPPPVWASNSEVISILLDVTNYPGAPGSPEESSNRHHYMNPQRIVFLHAKMSGWQVSMGGPAPPGVGADMMYRDMWGSPYTITIDTSGDGLCRDLFYRTNTVSGGGVSKMMIPDKRTPPFWYYRGKVMVWSPGPDKLIDDQVPANLGVNKDNICSWQ
jgi:prepilin-type N-terminal cleavage/methylation domain-containing protein